MADAPPEDPERTRFQVELEFVQTLANPVYLSHLAQNGYMKDERFIAYLDYLQYWKQPAYARFLRYPICLAMLDLLQDANVRTAVARDDIVRLIHHQQYFHWRSRGIAAALPPAPSQPSVRETSDQR